ncbi:MAG: hypothetical protein AAF721_27605 [Myxococcota bacterium]
MQAWSYEQCDAAVVCVRTVQHCAAVKPVGCACSSAVLSASCCEPGPSCTSAQLCADLGFGVPRQAERRAVRPALSCSGVLQRDEVVLARRRGSCSALCVVWLVEFSQRAAPEGFD